MSVTIKRWNITIPQLTGKKERRAYVCLPEGYEENADKRYPVIYMFDGHNLFSDEEATYGKCWGLYDYMQATCTQVIIAAVECNHEGHCRLEEYSPINFTFKDGTPIKAKGKKYMDWLVGTFKPFIDENFRTLPQRSETAIAGSSMGGLMTLYAVAKYSKYFSRGAALSPSLWMGGGSTVNFLQSATYRKHTHIYTDYGSLEFSNHAAQKRAFAEAVSLLIQKGVVVTARIVDGGVHSEASWEKQIPYFMRALGFFPHI